MSDALLSNAALRAAPAAVAKPIADDRLKPLRVQPVRALKAVRKLLADKDDTVQVFEIMQAPEREGDIPRPIAG